MSAGIRSDPSGGKVYIQVDGADVLEVGSTNNIVLPNNGKIGSTGDPDALSIDSSGNLTLTSGNLVVSSGKGIDFSANANETGSTSELLDDYEEGTWTPFWETNIINFSSVTYNSIRKGNYTRIGNTVFFSCEIATDAITRGLASGDIHVAGLPFDAIERSGASLARVSGFLGEHPITAMVDDFFSRISLYYRTTLTGATVQSGQSDLDTSGTQSNYLVISGVYFTGDSV